MKKQTALDLVMDELIVQHDTERKKLDRIDGWIRWQPERHKLPRKATPEHKALQQLSEAPHLSLVVTTIVQMLIAERVYSENSDEKALKQIWAPWQRNRMARTQNAIYRAACGYGLAYARVTPGDSGAVIKGRSPRETYAVYRDPADDEFPEYVLEVRGGPEARRRYVTLWDDTTAHVMSVEDGKPSYIEPQRHDVGVTPFVRYANQLDLEGRAPGDVEPLIPIAAKINKTDYDRLLVQHFNSWKVRTATNLDQGVTDEEAAQRKLKLAQDDILTGGDGVEFGTLSETSVEPFIKAKESDLDDLAALSQTPITAFGKLINLSAEALVEARAALYAKRDERRESFGMSNTDVLRLSAHVEGRTEHAEDFTLRVGWADTESRTLNQAVDALGKAATMLGVPPELLWNLIPGIDHTTAESWRSYAEDHPNAESRLVAALAKQSEPFA